MHIQGVISQCNSITISPNVVWRVQYPFALRCFMRLNCACNISSCVACHDSFVFVKTVEVEVREEDANPDVALYPVTALVEYFGVDVVVAGTMLVV